MAFEDLSPEVQEKLRACETEEELRELANALGAELSDEELRAVAGGTCRIDCALLSATCRRDLNCTAYRTDCPIQDACFEFQFCLTEGCEDLSIPMNTECTNLINGADLFPCKPLSSLAPK